MKVSGKTWKDWIEDDSYWENLIIEEVEGTVTHNNKKTDINDIEPSDIPDNAIVDIQYGFLNTADSYTASNPKNLVRALSSWRAKQSKQNILFEIEKGTEKQLMRLAKEAGLHLKALSK